MPDYVQKSVDSYPVHINYESKLWIQMIKSKLIACFRMRYITLEAGIAMHEDEQRDKLAEEEKKRNGMEMEVPPRCNFPTPKQR